MRNASTYEEGENLLHSSNDEKLLRIHRKVAYAAGNFLTVLAVALWFPYAVSFFTNVVGLSPQSAGKIVLLGQVGGAISTPFIGTWSDQCRCRIPGRRKIFHLTGIIVTSCSFFFLWFHCLGCEGASEEYKVLYYAVFAIIFQFGWAATQVGQLALMPELSSKKEILVELNSLRYISFLVSLLRIYVRSFIQVILLAQSTLLCFYRYCFTLLASVLVFCCMWVLLEKVGGEGSLNNHFSSNDKPVFWVRIPTGRADPGFYCGLPS